MKVPEAYRLKDHPILGSDSSYGNNGFFVIPHHRIANYFYNCQVSDGMGWQHVSVTLTRTKQVPSRFSRLPNRQESVERCCTWEIYYGQYPSTFVKRIEAMFPNSKLLHLCCGRCKINGAVNVDFHPLPEADVVADVENLPDDLKQQEFDVVLIDPPYSDQDADRYKVPRLVNAQKVMKQAKESLRTGGYLLWLDEKYPSYRRNDWKLVGLISIITGFERRVRVLSIFRKPPPSLP